MTGLSFEFILNAARSYVEKCHAEYMAAHGTDPDRNHRLDTPWLVTSQIDGLTWVEGWARDESTSAENGVVTGNWNRVTDAGPEREDGTRDWGVTVPGGDVMERLGEIFERAGLETEWIDNVSTCCECNRLIQTEPDSHGWRPRYTVHDGGYTCTACHEDNRSWEDELEELAHSRGVLSCDGVDPSEHGYTAMRMYRLGWDGWHSAERAESECARLDVGIGYFFQCSSARQFGSTRILWVSNDDVDRIPAELYGEADPDEIDKHT